MPSDLGSTLRVAVRARSSAGHTVLRTAVTAPVTPNVLSIANLAAQVSPIAPTVTVSFDLNKAAAIRIVIRDAAGAVVKKLDNADHPAGPVLKRWGEILDGGLPAPHGGYTALITATTATEFTSASDPVHDLTTAARSASWAPTSRTSSEAPTSTIWPRPPAFRQMRSSSPPLASR